MPTNQQSTSTIKTYNPYKIQPNSILRVRNSKDDPKQKLLFFFTPSDFKVSKDISGGYDEQTIPGVNFVLLWWKGGIKHKVRFKTFLSNLPHTSADKSSFLETPEYTTKDELHDFTEFVNLTETVYPNDKKPPKTPFQTMYTDPFFYLTHGTILGSRPSLGIIDTIRSIGVGAASILAQIANFNVVGSNIKNKGDELPKDMRPRTANMPAGKSITDVNIQRVQEEQGKFDPRQHKVGSKILGTEDVINLKRKLLEKKQLLDWQGRPVDDKNGINTDLQVLDRFVARSSSVFVKPTVVELILFSNKGNTSISTKYVGHVTDLEFSNWKFNENGVPTYVDIEVELTVLDYITEGNTVSYSFKQITKT